MGAKRKTPAPPKIQLPGPTDQEKQLMSQQTDLINQLNQQQQTGYNNAQYQNTQANNLLSMLDPNSSSNPLTAQLSPQQMAGINQNYQTMRDNLLRNLDTGSYKRTYDTNMGDNIASLAAKGVLDSTTGRQTLGDMEIQRQSDYANAEGQAQQAMNDQITQLRSDLANQAMTGAQQYGNLASTNLNGGLQAAQLGSGTNNQLNQNMAQERYNQAGIAAQNAQQQYLWRLSNFQQGKSAGQRLGGAASGALGGAATGAMVGGPWGAAIGGTLGAIGGLF